MKNVLCFVLGATAGTLVTWKLLDKKYKEMANDEINEIREYYRSKYELADFVKDADKVSYAHKDISNSIDLVEKEELTEVVEDLGYSTNDDDYTVKVDQQYGIEPYTITPEEFGEQNGFDTKTWMYYADDVLTNEIGEIVDEPEFTIGDALTHFGEYEDDSVYVRNENDACDYEILKHDKTFEEFNLKNTNRIEY